MEASFRDPVWPRSNETSLTKEEKKENSASLTKMSCSAVGCTNRYTKGSTLQLFRFPLRDANRLRQWLRNVRRINWTPSESSRLCSVHFEENDFCTNKEGHRRLKDTAVPTIFNFTQSFSKRLSSRKLSWSSLYGIVGVGDSSLCPPLLLGTNAAMPLKKMVSSDLQLHNQDESAHAKDPEPLQTKEEREELSISQDREHQALKQEVDTFLSSTPEESDQKPLCHDSHANESQDQNGQSGETGTNAEGESTESLHISESNSCNIAHSSNFLVFHTYALPGIKSFECQTCGKDFRSECKLNEHMISHTDVKPYCCDTCGKRFRCSTTLNMHVRLHTGERPYSCKTCGMCFRRSHTLMVHMRMHTGEKPYLCKTCGKDFPFSSVLKVHMRIHTGEKPYLCDICGKSFCQKTELIGHTRVHTGERPYSCKTCGLNFKRSNSLKVHMRRHTGDKPFNCETCGKKFRVKGCLTIHTRKAHTGEKPYCCKICGERFFESYHLAKHIRCHTDC